MSADGSGLRRLTSDPAYEGAPRFSPDGRFVVFEGERAGQPEIFRVEVESGRVEQLTDSASRKLGPAYSPDGGTIAFMERRFIRWRVSGLDTRTGKIRALSEDAWGACRPAFAPDGLIAYVSTAESPKADLWFREMKGPREGRAWRLPTRPDAHNYDPAFSADGMTIAFASTRERGAGEKWDIFRADRNGRNLVQLTQGPGNNRFPDFNPVRP
jgi:TolB protein